MGRRGEGYVIVQFLLLALIAGAPLVRLGGPWPAPLGPLAQLAGLLLILAGAALAFAGLARLGLRNLSVLPHPTADAQLIDTGIYGLARHPIYGGLLAGSLGWGLLTHSLLALAFTAALWLWFELKTRREETALRAKFPTYPAYAQRVRKFWPFLY